MTKKEPFIVPLNISLGTIIDESYVRAAYEEADQYPLGSREHKAFISYAKRLEKILEHQKKIDEKPKT